MSLQNSTQKFDYESLDIKTSKFIQQQTGEIRGLMRRTAQDIFEIGQKLIQIKEKLGHGRFGTWLSVEFGWTERTAQQFMNVARQFKSENFSDLQLAPSALYVLAAPSTSAKARQEAIERAASGEMITHKTAKVIKKKYDTETSPTSAPSTPASQPIITAIRPRTHLEESISAPSAVSPEVPLAQPTPIESQRWQSLGLHQLYWGQPNSPQFLHQLPSKIALSLAFPPTPDWRLDLPHPPNSTITLFSPYLDVDPQTFSEMIRSILLLYSESQDSIIVSFAPDPCILPIAHELGCRCWIAEPDQKRCQAVISRWHQLITD